MDQSEVGSREKARKRPGNERILDLPFSKQSPSPRAKTRGADSLPSPGLVYARPDSGLFARAKTRGGMSLLGSGLVYARPDSGLVFSRPLTPAVTPSVYPEGIWRSHPFGTSDPPCCTFWRGDSAKGASPPCGLAGISLRLRGVVRASSVQVSTSLDLTSVFFSRTQNNYSHPERSRGVM
jgi:hypothetical protein